MVLQIIDKKDCQDVRIFFYRAQGLNGMTSQSPFNRLCFDFNSNRQGKQGAMQQPLSAAGNQPTRIVNQVKIFSSECRGGDHRWLLVMFLHVRMHHVCYGVNATTCIETKFHNRRYTCCA